jgi:hypothetical protein
LMYIKLTDKTIAYHGMTRLTLIAGLPNINTRGPQARLLYLPLDQGELYGN